MKRLLILLILLFVYPAQAQQCTDDTQLARLSPAMMGGVPAAGCTYPTKDSRTTGGDYDDFRLSYNYSSSSFTSGSAYTLVRISVNLKAVGTAPVANITGYIFNDNSGEPGTLRATSTSTITAGSISSTYADYNLEFSDVVIENATKYHIALSKAYTDSSNKIVWNMNSSVTGQVIRQGDTAPPTGVLDNSAQAYFITYSCN